MFRFRVSKLGPQRTICGTGLTPLLRTVLRRSPWVDSESCAPSQKWVTPN